MAMMAMAGMMLASCMGDSYADPEMVETIPAPPYGNRADALNCAALQKF